MLLKGLAKISANIATATTSRMLIEIDKNNKEIHIKEWIISKLLLNYLYKAGHTEIEKVEIKSDGIHLEHKIFGTILIVLRRLTFNKKESVITYDALLLDDKLKNERDNNRINSMVTGVVGGVLAWCSFGFAGGKMIATATTDLIESETKYNNIKKCDFLGENNSLSTLSPIVLDPKNYLLEVLEKNNGEINFPFISKVGTIAISLNLVEADVLDHLIENVKIAQKEMLLKII